MKLLSFALSCALLSCASGIAQDVGLQAQKMKSAYAPSGSFVVIEDHTLLIQPNMPGPICALPRIKDGKTNWSFFAFPLASITVPLSAVDEEVISEDFVFTRSDAPGSYHPGDVGDTTMVVIMSLPGKQFHTLTYDREKLAHLGPGPHDSSAYGQVPDDVEAFGLVFADHDAASAFVSAFRNAVTLVKTQAAKH
jgi:hypothetical protein